VLMKRTLLACKHLWIGLQSELLIGLLLIENLDGAPTTPMQNPTQPMRLRGSGRSIDNLK
jgi:hypothetical protein